MYIIIYIIWYLCSQNLGSSFGINTVTMNFTYLYWGRQIRYDETVKHFNASMNYLWSKTNNFHISNTLLYVYSS